MDEIGEAISKHNLELVLFNMPPGNFGEGERGLACLPDRINEFEDSVEAALEYAVPLGCSRLHCMAGIKPDNYSQKKIRDTYIKNIQYAADKCAPKNINIMIEAINTRDMPNFYLNYSSQASQLLNSINRENVKMQFDIYHMQIMEGDLTPKIKKFISEIGHMQLADTPGRHEPGTGEINYPFIFSKIDEYGYKNWIGCEYKPISTTVDGLHWIQNYLDKN